ncbi:HupE/UreJ family protein [Caenimonas terrae]|uniref:HupE/UreJ family protein n=1 Tax=Caenimonas terrae TaxID=696074 RepID=A0ABW0NKY3_9BURK
MKRCIAFLFALLLAGAALAHKPSDSYLTLRAEEGKSEVTARWDIALRDLDYVLQLDRDTNGELTWGEVRQRSADITRVATQNLQLSTGDRDCPWETTAPLQLDHHSDGTYAVLSLVARCPGLDAGLKLHYSLFFDVDPSHRGLVQWVAPGGTASQALVFGTESAEQTLALQSAGAWPTLRQYLVDGIWHIWIGYDHILFLLSLLLPSVLVRREGRWTGAPGLGGAVKEVLKVVTAFTLAHSITLSLAALQIISLPSRLVESAIALSVVFAALNNLRGTIESKRWVMAFAFGLIHGFGFASVLADLGLPQGALVLALVGFNGGVEVGQLAIVAVFLPLAYLLRGTGFYQRGVLKAGSLIVAAIATWWFVQRVFDLQGGPF